LKSRRTDEMQILLQAGFVSVDEIDGALMVGFADRQVDTSKYFMLQRGLDPTDDDGVYLEHTDQAYGTYGQVLSCSLSSGRIEVTVDEATARSLGTEATFAVEFSCDHPSLLRLRSGIERIFAGTDCRLQVTGTGAIAGSPISHLDTLLRTMEPVLNPGTYVFARVEGDRPIDQSKVVASIREPEGLSLIVEESVAESEGLVSVFRCAWITLNVSSDLAAVGLTAAFAAVLACAGIGCNVVAGLNHDHVFVPLHQAEQAMVELKALQEGQR